MEGLKLDLTYTAKAMAGLIADVRRRPPKGPIFFWSTLSGTDIAPLVTGVTTDGLAPELRQVVRSFHPD
jgi:hypothetical protein